MRAAGVHISYNQDPRAGPCTLVHHCIQSESESNLPTTRPTYERAFAQTVTTNECTKMFYGDTNGWLYSYTGRPGDTPESEFWARELNLISEVRVTHQPQRGLLILNAALQISSICISDSRCVATSFGPSPKILVQDLASTKSVSLDHSGSIRS